MHCSLAEPAWPRTLRPMRTAIRLVVIASLLLPALPARAAEPALEELVTGLSSPVFVTSPPDDSRLFIVEQGGDIHIFKNGALLPTPFLDVSGLISRGGERGLLGLAFHPDFQSNGRFFINYTDTAGATVVAEFRVSGDPDRADPSWSQQIIRIPQPRSNHNGGMIAFGPDGYLYIGMGDSGGGGDPDEDAQNPDTLLGSMLRLDVDSAVPYAIPATNPVLGNANVAQEVWAYGLRNPWRFSFDGDELYIADVGQNAREEVNVVDATSSGYDFGWDHLEGSIPYENGSHSGSTLPVVEYTHAEGFSITGGYVYQGPGLPSLRGTYFYGDYVAGFIRSFRYSGGVATEQQDWTSRFGTVSLISSFGRDSLGDIYVVSLGGTIYKMQAGATRLAGPDRYATAATISAQTHPGGSSSVYIGTGENWPDALALAAAAGHNSAPLLLVTRTGIPSATRTELDRLNPSTIYVGGGSGVVSDSVIAQLGAYGNVTRLSGTDRYATAAAISQATYPGGASTVYVGTGENWPDALALAAAAGAEDAPLLLVQGNTVPGTIRAELARLDPATIVIGGGAGVISNAVAAELASYGTVTRLAGSDRYATAASISASTYPNPATVDLVYVATGENWPDALALAAAAGHERAPLLLARRDTVPSPTLTEFNRLDVSDSIIAGGLAVLSSHVQALLGPE